MSYGKVEAREIAARATRLERGESGREERAGVGREQQVRNFLLSESDRLHSKGLALLAQKLTADPFAKASGGMKGEAQFHWERVSRGSWVGLIFGWLSGRPRM